MNNKNQYFFFIYYLLRILRLLISYIISKHNLSFSNYKLFKFYIAYCHSQYALCVINKKKILIFVFHKKSNIKQWIKKNLKRFFII